MEFRARRRFVRLEVEGETLLTGFSLSDLVVDEGSPVNIVKPDGSVESIGPPTKRALPISIKVERAAPKLQDYVNTTKAFTATLLVKEAGTTATKSYLLLETVILAPGDPTKLNRRMIYLRPKEVKPVEE